MKVEPLTVKEAASKMGCCEKHARRVLVALDRQNPGMGLIQRPSGKTEGRIAVNPLALVLIRSRSTTEAIEQLDDRLALLECSNRTFRTRLTNAEKKLIRLESRQMAS